MRALQLFYFFFKCEIRTFAALFENDGVVEKGES